MTAHNAASERQTEDTPILLIPGFWLGSWCYSDVVMELAARGRRAAAVDLAGHGLLARRPTAATARPFSSSDFAVANSPLADVTLDDAAAVLSQQIKRLGAGAPVTVVAHSLAGPVLTRVAQESPRLFAQAVYLAAFMPATDVPALAYSSAPENEGQQVVPALVADPAAVGATRLDPTSPDPAYRELLRAGLFGDVDPAKADAALALLSPDGPIGIATGTTSLTRDGWGSVPRTYITCSQDQIVRPALQRRFIDEANAAYRQSCVDVVNLDAAHCPFLSIPDQLASTLCAIG